MNSYSYIQRLFLLIILFTLLLSVSYGQELKTFSNDAPHPRLISNVEIKQAAEKYLSTDENARKAFEQARQNIELFVNRHKKDPKWIVSRLQMYWKTKSTDVYIKGGIYSHAEGEAPVPTVKFPGARDNVTIYAAPKIDSILPYMDDPRGVFLINKSKPGKPMEWVEISKTARILESINTQIMQMAYNAAIAYWISKDEKYARFAFDLFDTYMSGMFYRKLPVDISHGHHQTITGLSTFEVIQEVAMLTNLVGTYDYIYDYLKKKAPQQMSIYSETFRKWADVQVQKGVAFNNWNLMQARNILNIGLILDGNAAYKDGKGQQYYIDVVLNKDFERQWSITKLANEGYDLQTGLWNESPGYSLGVLGDFTGLVTYFDNHFNRDILPQMPILSKAAIAISQYLFPNGYISSFGDSHYRRLTTNAAEELITNAQKNKKADEEETLTRFVKTIKAFNNRTASGSKDLHDSHGTARGIGGMLSAQNAIHLNENTPPGKIENYVTPVFYSPKVSFLALRNGFDSMNGLMVAMSGSKGNHMHAGGISMEIFGKGVVLGPESGIGTSYFQQDYAEYYSQFPAHNTVAVDGISAYPVMKSNHGFELQSSYPTSGVNRGFFSNVSYADMLFVEPETMSDQNRLTSIIRTSDTTGYYIDIFRSKRRDNKDKMHDYFFHNLGQGVTVTDIEGKELDLKSTGKLSFSGGHLFAYDYFWDKKSIITPSDFNATFNLKIPEREDVSMNMWMRGSEGREIFSVKAPPSKAFGKNAMIPDSIAALPMPTIVARQSGEAWKNPFVAIYEPSSSSQPKSIVSIKSFTPSKSLDEFVGLEIESRSGSKEFVFSSADKLQEVVHEERSFKGTYAVISETQDNTIKYLFLGNGSKIIKGGFSIIASSDTASSALIKGKDGWYFTSNQPVAITLPANDLKEGSTLAIDLDNKSITIKGRKDKINGIRVISFLIPAAPLTKMEWR